MHFTDSFTNNHLVSLFINAPINCVGTITTKQLLPYLAGQLSLENIVLLPADGLLAGLPFFMPPAASTASKARFKSPRPSLLRPLPRLIWEDNAKTCCRRAANGHKSLVKSHNVHPNSTNSSPLQHTTYIYGVLAIRSTGHRQASTSN